jgi:hypothetical protein
MQQLLGIKTSINWYSIWLIMLVVFSIKVCWYSNYAFGRVFMRYYKSNSHLFMSHRVYVYILGSVVELLMVAIASVLFHQMGVDTVWEGAMWGFLAFILMFMVLLMCSLVDGRLLDVLMVNASYFFFITVSVGSVLGWLN